MTVAGVFDAQNAFYSSSSGVDWDVIFLHRGMMIIVGVPQMARAVRIPGDLRCSGSPAAGRLG
jgi:hypothetical protein